MAATVQQRTPPPAEVARLELGLLQVGTHRADVSNLVVEGMNRNAQKAFCPWGDLQELLSSDLGSLYCA